MNPSHRLATAALICVAASASINLIAQEPHAKPAIRGLVSMGAYKFVGAGGEPVNTLEPIKAVHKNKKRRVGRFWSPEYRQAWTRLQEQLAAKYDSWPLIREVSITSCMSFTAEPFFLPSEDSVQKPIRAAGFTDEAYKTCLQHSLDDYAAWKSTRLVLSVNPLRTAVGQGPGDPEFTMNIMRACRKRLGERCVFDNHNLDTKLPRPYPGFPIVPDAKLREWAKLVEANKPR
jgi:hypothetical protein